METGDNFHVLLASNTTNNIKPNTPSNFSVRLPTSLYLKDYEVGVSQISYPCSLMNVSEQDARFVFTIDDNSKGSGAESSDSADTERIEFSIKPGQYEDISMLVSKLNFQTVEHADNRITFSYIKELDMVRCNITVAKNSRFTLSMADNLLYMLGYQDTRVFGTREYTTRKLNASKTKQTYTYEADHHPEMNPTSFCFFVYSDIVRPLMFSDVYAPLIFYSTYTGKHGEYSHERVKEILYRPIDVNFVQEIGVEIRDSSGFLVDFSWGKVFVLLHFRKMKHL